MTPSLEYNPMYQLLEHGDIIRQGDEWYDPITDTWKLVVDDDPDTSNFGCEYDPDLYKPFRRPTSVIEEKSQCENCYDTELYPDEECPNCGRIG